VASTTARGYGWTHQQLRAALLATYSPSQPCPRCGRPLGPWPELLDLGHLDGTAKTAYAGLEHRRCNRQAGAREGNRQRGRDGSITRVREHRRRRRRWRPIIDDADPPASRRSRAW
jgi:hypothetical protein